MKKRMLRPMRLVRWTDGILPAVWLAGSVFAPGKTALMFGAWLFTRLCGLFTADGVRMAYATQPSMRDVNGSTTLALLIQLLGAAGLACFIGPEDRNIWILLGMGALLNIEHVFYEFLHAAGEKYSAMICRVLTGAFLLLILLTETNEWVGLGLTALAAFIAKLIALIIGGYRPGRLNLGVFKAVPRAVVYGVLYPLSVSMLHRFLGLEFNRLAFFGGLILFELCRTPFRRSALESRTMNRLLFAAILLCIAAGIAAYYLNLMKYIIYPVTLAVSAVCAFVLWGSIRLRRDA